MRASSVHVEPKHRKKDASKHVGNWLFPTLAAVSACTAVGVLMWYAGHSSPSKPGISPVTGQTSFQLTKSVPSISKDERATTPATVGSFSKPKRQIVWAKDASTSKENYLDVLSDPSGFVKRAKAGDGAAAMALFQTAMHCRPASRPKLPTTSMTETKSLPPRTPQSQASECASLPPEVVQDRIGWLDLAAAAGDPSALVSFGSNARVLYYLDPTSAWQNPGEIEIVKQKSLSYLLVGAQMGIRDAYLSMFEALDQGLYGPQDKVLAYSYLLALSKMDPNFSRSADLTLYSSKLTLQEQTRAVDLAIHIANSCCDRR